MNPLAPLYDPALLESVTITTSSASQDDAKAPASHSTPSHVNNVQPGSGHNSCDPTKMHPDFQQGGDVTQRPTRSSTAASIYQANVMSQVLQQRDLPPYQSRSMGQSNLELTHYAPRQKQQTVPGDGSGYTLSQHGVHQYKEYASAPTFHPHTIQPPPFWFQLQPQQPFAPLPPSYPYPHIDPPQPGLSPFGPQRRDRPYDNTALATHYLSLFTDLYGTSPTSLDSLRKICITLGYADHANHANHSNNLHASRSSTPTHTYSSHQGPRSHGGRHNRRIHRSGRHSAEANSTNRNTHTPSTTSEHTQNTNTNTNININPRHPHLHPHLQPSSAILPQTIRQAQIFIKARYVNIFDLVDAGARGESVTPELLFRSAAELRAYSEGTRRVCPSEVGRDFGGGRGSFGAKGEGEASRGEFGVLGEGQGGNELWRWMLRKWS
jgi:hypothetical protein